MATRTNAGQGGARELMIESAIFLMRESGLSGAGINQVIAHSKAPKGSLYYHFPRGKLQLTSEALALYGDRVAAAFEDALASAETPAGKVRALFRLVSGRLEESDFEQSCAAGTVTLDIRADVAALRPVVARIMASWQAVVARHLPMGSAARTRSFAGLVITAIEGGYVRGRAERSSAPLREAGEWLAKLVGPSGEPARRSRARRASGRTRHAPST